MTRTLAGSLRPLLEEVARRCSSVERVAADPLEFPHRYRDPRDVEVVGLLSASLAYGRVDIFKPKIDAIVQQLGASPSRTLADLTVKQAGALLHGFVYRFNVAADLAVLLLGMGRLVARRGSLEQAFLDGEVPGDWKASLVAFVRGVREAAPRREIVRVLGEERGVDHLLPVGAGAHKRLNLYLRWMVRGPDGVDLGAWKRLEPSRLVIPLDTHIGRIARLIGLTPRRDLSWRTAEEITAALRVIDPQDPVRFDFPLCHLGISGACPVRAAAQTCRVCPLRPRCRSGRRL